MALFEGNAVNGLSYPELIGAGVVKYAEEKALTQYIGNGTVKSGLIKGLIGAGIKSFAPAGTVRNVTSAAFSIDAVEDILTALMSGSSLFSTTNNNGNVSYTDFIGA